MTMNIHGIIDQMEQHGGLNGTGRCPVFKGLIVRSDQFNLFFEGQVPLIEYLDGARSSMVAAGLVGFGHAIESMWKQWILTELVSRTPFLGFVWKKSGSELDHNGVVFFEMNRVSIHDSWLATFNWKWGPAIEHHEELMHQMKMGK